MKTLYTNTHTFTVSFTFIKNLVNQHFIHQQLPLQLQGLFIFMLRWLADTMMLTGFLCVHVCDFVYSPSSYTTSPSSRASGPNSLAGKLCFRCNTEAVLKQTSTTEFCIFTITSFCQEIGYKQYRSDSLSSFLLNMICIAIDFRRSIFIF